MKGFAAVGAVFALAGAAWAQNNPAQADPVEERVRRLQQGLQLTEEQVGKARDIYKKQFEDIRGILTDDQKRRYDEMNQGNTRGNNNPAGNRPAFGGRGNTPGGLPATDELKTQLSLTEDQVTKINALRDGLREEMRNFFRNRAPGQDFQAWMEKTRDENTRKIREVLTEEQKPKFDEIVKNAASQPPPGRGRGNTNPNGTPGRGGRGGTLDERVAAVMEALRVEKPEEADAVKAVVRRVLELMDRLDAAQRDSRTKIDEAARNTELSDQGVGDRIDEVRKALKDVEKELAAARKDLADVVTNRQELELLRRGILR